MCRCHFSGITTQSLEGATDFCGCGRPAVTARMWHAVGGNMFSGCACVRPESSLTRCFITHLGEFHQIYKCGTLGDKGELVRFWVKRPYGRKTAEAYVSSVWLSIKFCLVLKMWRMSKLCGHFENKFRKLVSCCSLANKLHTITTFQCHSDDITSAVFLHCVREIVS